jgi:hypothetical protein
VPSRAVGSRLLSWYVAACARASRPGSRKARPSGWRLAAAGGLGLLAAGCGGGAPALSVAAKQRFLDSVYGQVPDISSYRTGAQLISMGQAVCADLSSGASVQVVADRIPLVEGGNPLPPTYLGVVIYSAVRVFCPKFDNLLNQ